MIGRIKQKPSSGAKNHVVKNPYEQFMFQDADDIQISDRTSSLLNLSRAGTPVFFREIRFYPDMFPTSRPAQKATLYEIICALQKGILVSLVRTIAETTAGTTIFSWTILMCDYKNKSYPFILAQMSRNLTFHAP